jgi:phage head maturation protease
LLVEERGRQIVTGDRVDRTAVAEELTEAVERGFIFAMSVGFFQRFDLLQVSSDGDVGWIEAGILPLNYSRPSEPD